MASMIVAGRNHFVREVLPALLGLALVVAPARGQGPQKEASQGLRIEAAPQRAVYDRPLNIQVSGLRPGANVAVRARATDRSGRTWSASATFQADPGGNVDLSSTAPVSGGYDVIDPMGLIWSMRPEGVEDPAGMFYVFPETGVATVTISATSGASQASAAVQRCSPRVEGVRRIKLRDQDLVGDLFLPADQAGGPRPGIVMLGGSEGGIPGGHAALLATHGYAALALAYFGPEPLPNQLVEIPLEYFRRGIDWLAAYREVDPQAIALDGGSRGAEAALLVAAQWPEKVAAVVARSPSSLVFQGLYADQNDYWHGLRSAWSLEGKPLPFADASPDMATIAGLMKGQLVSFRQGFANALAQPRRNEKAVIPVEHIGCPVLLIAGTDDQMWPSVDMVKQIAARRQEAGVAAADVICTYPGAGHSLFPPYVPTCAVRFGNLLLGGSAKANALAGSDAHHKALEFLAKHLKTRH